jgi:transcriptional regulator with XRE-family HTH domain
MITMSPARPNKAGMTPQQLRQIIEAAGITQAQAAERLGVRRNTVVRWLMGHTPISKPMAFLIRHEFKK